MLHRTHRSVALVLCVLGLVTAGLIWPDGVSATKASDPTIRTIRFDEIEALARTESPRVRILGQQVANDDPAILSHRIVLKLEKP